MEMVANKNGILFVLPPAYLKFHCCFAHHLWRAKSQELKKDPFKINPLFIVKTQKLMFMATTPKRTWITEKEAADLIQLPGKFLRKLVTAGSLKGVVNYFKSKGYRYNKVDLENYMFENSFFAGL